MLLLSTPVAVSGSGHTGAPPPKSFDAVTYMQDRTVVTYMQDRTVVTYMQDRTVRTRCRTPPHMRFLVG